MMEAYIDLMIARRHPLAMLYLNLWLASIATTAPRRIGGAK